MNPAEASSETPWQNETGTRWHVWGHWSGDRLRCIRSLALAGLHAPEGSSPVQKQTSLLNQPEPAALTPAYSLPSGLQRALYRLWAASMVEILLFLHTCKTLPVLQSTWAKRREQQVAESSGFPCRINACGANSNMQDGGWNSSCPTQTQPLFTWSQGLRKDRSLVLEVSAERRPWGSFPEHPVSSAFIHYDLPQCAVPIIKMYNLTILALHTLLFLLSLLVWHVSCPRRNALYLCRGTMFTKHVLNHYWKWRWPWWQWWLAVT